MLMGMDVPESQTSSGGASSNILDWVKRLQAIAQTGLTYAKDHYDIERYRSVRHRSGNVGSELERYVVNKTD
jgi:hypothetical protein